MGGENLVQLAGGRPDMDSNFATVTLVDQDAGCATTVSWNANDCPSCLLWLSNRGRSTFPWNGTHCALGVEPICAAFDLGTAVSTNPKNPIAASGVPTCIQFKASETWTTRYRI